MKTLGLILGAVIFVTGGWFLHDYYPRTERKPLSNDGNQPITIADGTVDVSTEGMIGKHPVLYPGTYVTNVYVLPVSLNPNPYQCASDTPGSGVAPCVEFDHAPDNGSPNPIGSVQIRSFQKQAAVAISFDPSLMSLWTAPQVSSAADDTQRRLTGSHYTKLQINGKAITTCGDPGHNVKCSVRVCLTTTTNDAICNQ
jgi:hypothetical protein